MYRIACAFQRTPEGLRFLPELSVADDHPTWCELRVSFRAEARLPSQDDAAVIWDGDVAGIEIRVWGTGFGVDMKRRCDLRDRHWRHLDGAAFEAAHGYLLLNHGRELWERAETYVEAEILGRVA